MGKILYVQGLHEDMAYRVGYGGVTEIRRTIQQTSTYYVYEIYKGKHLHSAIMGSAVAEIAYFPPETNSA